MSVATQTFATVADLLTRYDARRIADLVGDSGSRVEPATLLTPSPNGNPVAFAALQDATQMILAAATVAARYSYEQLYGDSTTTPATPGSNLAKRLCCDLGFALLTGRRGYTESQQGSLTPRAAEAQAMLEALRRGERLLDCYSVRDGVVIRVDDHAAAGLPTKILTTPFDDASLLTANTRLFGIRVTGPYDGGY